MINERGLRGLSGLRPIRRLLLPLFAVVNPGDITIRHHFTGTSFRLHSFRHKGYWFHGRRREKETMKYFQDFIEAGDSVIEVGGHIGYISIYLAQLAGAAGKVFVLEPGKNNLPYLRRNIGEFTNINIIETGAADFDGELTLYMEDLTGQNNSFVKNYEVLESNIQRANVDPKIMEARVPVMKIDTLVKDHSLGPAFIKIDVEGFELQVLKGSRAALYTSKPGLMVEVTRHAPEVFSLLREQGYECYNELRTKIRDPAEILGRNIFCIHPDAHRDRAKRLGVEC